MWLRLFQLLMVCALKALTLQLLILQNPATVLAEPALSKDAAPKNIVAEVGELPITRSELDAEYALQLGGSSIGFFLKHRDRLSRQLLRQIIDRKLLLREAARKHPKGRVEVDDAAVERALRVVRGAEKRADRFDRMLRFFQLTDAELREPLRERLAVEQYLNQTIAHSYLASEEEMNAELRADPERYRLIEERRVRHILIPLDADDPPEEAARWERLAVQIKALSASTEFVLLAKRYATKAARAKGGEIGWVTRNQFEKGFADTVFSLPLLVVSDPFRTADGINIVRVEEIRGGGSATTEQLRGQLSARVIARKRKAALDLLLKKAREATRVIVYLN